MAKLAPEVLAHLEWIGFLQPTGLVVSAPALVRAGAILNRNDQDGQRRLRAAIEERAFDPKRGPEPYLRDFRAFAQNVLGWRWSPKVFAGTDEAPIPDELRIHLPDYEETLQPDYAVRERDADENRCPWQLLVRTLEPGQDLDKPVKGPGHLEASPHARLERLLRRTGAPAGLLFNGRALRLVSAPHGESSGWLDFRVADMVATAGRPICSALRLLLSEERLLALPRGQRLAALLESSRKFQNEVSERLAEQVLHALYELLRGFQAAHDASRAGGERGLLREPLSEDPDEVYRGLLTVLLRMVFLLYAEERDMLPADETFLRHYSLAGLHERLRADAALHPDTMDQRFGAWAQLLVLFRMVHDGAQADGLRLPTRRGVLFDPQRFPFLEGRATAGARQRTERIDPPLVPDGTLQRVLDKLLVLDGERLSYRALDVEQIGSVYETMMGFRLETATGPSVAIKAQKKQGAPTAVDLGALLAEPSKGREKWLQARTDRKLSDKIKQAVKASATLEDLHAALLPVIDRAASPDLVPAGAMVLQPSEERRRSGSHYTPRELTEPIVRTTLEPILARLAEGDGRAPRPEAILDLKVCDPAMGSGAFLVEACRQLADALVEAWRVHDDLPEIPADEREEIFAMRLVAQRCLYGVDKNPMAVDLAKVSLWLVTLARDHALTFVDHALRHGDSLVGLSNAQIAARDWSGEEPLDSPNYRRLTAEVDEVVELRRSIREASDEIADGELRRTLDDAEHKASRVRTYGDLVVEAFFAGSKDKERRSVLAEAAKLIASGDVAAERPRLDERRREDPPLAPFHWEIEFPEVFERENRGFDAVVGNPPFLGGTRISELAGMTYFQWLVTSYPPCEHHCDLVAYFFRRSFDLLRDGACLGLIATNTIAQGDTREGGLVAMLKAGGRVYSATRRYKWPGQAAVVVSVVHVSRGVEVRPARLDDQETARISAYLVPGSTDASPVRLRENPYFSLGSKIYGQGFLFADDDPECTPIAERQSLLAAHPDWIDRVPPYIGGQEVNSDPMHSPRRFAIYLSDVDDERDLDAWPELKSIVERKVKPERLRLGTNPNNVPLKRRWWAYQAHRPELYKAIAGLERVLVISRVGQQAAFTFLSAGTVFSEQLIVFPLPTHAAFCALQSRPHELWARFFGSSLEDRLRYTPSDCFETFPFPEGFETHPGLEAAGQAYDDFRAALMVETGLGLTKTYNRFHDQDERDPKIERLRELHAAMDCAVLDAYGWTDLQPTCEFLLDYEIDESTWSPRRKKPYRYRWPAPLHDEVLARLLDLNAQRAAEERRAGLAAQGTSKKRSRRSAKHSETGDLFS
jgi:hypothetical protein